MKYLLTVVLFLTLSTGCVLTKALIPDVQTRMTKEELQHKSGISTATQNNLATLLKAGGLETDRAKLSAAKLIYKTGVNADDIAPSAAENLLQQYVRTQAQGSLDSQLDAGFQWSTKLISQVAGGGVGGVGLAGWMATMLRRSSRRKKALGVVSAELSAEEKAKVKIAMNHTDLERELG